MAKGVRVGGPLGPFRDGAEQALRALEYSEGRVGHLLLVMAHLSRWLDECGLGVADLTSEAVEQFFVTFRRASPVVQVFEITASRARTPGGDRSGANCRSRSGTNY